MSYQVALGWNQEGSLADLVPQPASPNPIVPPRRIYAASGAYPDGTPSIELVFSVLEPSEKNTVDTAFGLSDTTVSNQVTVSVRKNDDTFANYNAEVEEIKDRARRALRLWRDVTYRVRLLEAL